MKGTISCPDNCGVGLRQDFFRLLESMERWVKARYKEEIDPSYEYVMHINSGGRCEERNRIVKGSRNSAHIKGLGADIKTINGHIAYFILEYIFIHKIKRLGIKLRAGFIHVDYAHGNLKFPYTKLKEYPQFVVWGY